MEIIFLPIFLLPSLIFAYIHTSVSESDFSVANVAEDWEFVIVE